MLHFSNDGASHPRSEVSSLTGGSQDSTPLELADLSTDRLLGLDSSERKSADSDKTTRPDTSSYFELSRIESIVGGRSYSDNLARDLVATEMLAHENEGTRPEPGLWKRQMLVDRTLRGMTALTSAFALAVTISCAILIPKFIHNIRLAPESSSINFSAGACPSMKYQSEILKIFVNAAATMVLGMSNTYQQLITALDIEDISHVLTKYGDSRVGTNSPLAINHKSKGRVKAWACWILLICTSLPVHFLANSLTGFSIDRPLLKFQQIPVTSSDEIPMGTDEVIYIAGLNMTEASYSTRYLHASSQIYLSVANDSRSAAFLAIYYEPNFCLVDPGSNNDRVFAPYVTSSTIEGYQNCSGHVGCIPSEWEENCHLVFRMQAGFILAGCLLIKAAYMVIVSFASRHSQKRQCLTFGDVLIAARLGSIQLSTECMLDVGDTRQREVQHQCHRHCKGEKPSMTGDEDGHCQKCAKFNKVSHVSTRPSPSRSTKQKKPFLSHLGQKALTQMMGLCFWTSIAVGYAAMMIFIYVTDGDDLKELGKTGFTPLTGDSLGLELLVMCLSNFPQLFFSVLYLLLIYNITLINMKYEWGKMETTGGRLRCSLVVGNQFDQSYYFNLPKKVLIPIIGFSIFTHWIISLAIQTTEEHIAGKSSSKVYNIIGINPAACLGCAGLMVLITAICWIAFSYRREGYIPSMFGSVRVLCAAAGELHEVPEDGHLKWGDLGKGPLYRRAGLSGGPVGEILPNELYAGGAAPQEHGESPSRSGSR